MEVNIITCYNCKYFIFHPATAKEFCIKNMEDIPDMWQYCDTYDEIERV